MAIIPAIITQHAEEAAFLWLLRDSAVSEPHYDLSDLAHLDDRVEAHIDGLRIAGEPGWEICREAIVLEEPGEIFAAAVLAFESRIPQRMKAVADVVGHDGNLLHPLISALAWIDLKRISDLIPRLLQADLPFLRLMGVATLSIHRQINEQQLTRYLRDADSRVRARTLKACGELGQREYLTELYSHFSDDDPNCRFYAAWSAALLRDISAAHLLKQFADQTSQYAARACDLLLRLLTPAEARDWLRHLIQQPDRLRLAVTGCGSLGDPAAIPWLIEMMQTPELARVAGESFSMITGIDIAYEDLEGEQPEGFETGPTEHPEDDDVDLDPDENLPWPKPELIQAWWSKYENRFRKGTRYLVGKPISRENCQQVLRVGYQRQRAAAAIELTMMQPGHPLFEVRAPGFKQQRMLGLKPGRT